MEAKPKRVCDEATLKRLSEMREKANAVRRKKAELKRADKEASKKDFEKQYEEKVLKVKPKPVVEETEKEPYEPAPSQPAPSEADDDDFPVETVAKTPKTSRPKAQSAPPPPPKEPNYKQMYYQHKLSQLQAQQQEQQFLQQYSRLPPYHHAVDIAKHQIKQRIDDDVLGSIYKGLFHP